ncbi:HEPN domain-containing protein [Streptomyces purpurogeneiscleroticus]|uniref:HEPN domain-containing protein n=1 Tax=Streptomyces purpurogeneiscleroticus TaxID=68259 RepID=UPI001CBC3A88|nr:HEPN domain-containing protein [Streptomyces purpurogeneiscleroticus]
MSKNLSLREAALAWLEYAGGLSPTPQSIVTLMLQPHWENVERAVAAAAPREEHPDLYAKVDGDWVPNSRTLLEGSGLGEAARLIAQGVPVPVSEVADSFVTFCTGPAPVPERWLLLNGTFPQGTRIPLGRHTLQTFTANELRQTVPMPALNVLQSRSRDLDLITGAPFLHVPDPGRPVTRRPTWFDFTGPRAEAQHWQALLPLMLWDSALLRVNSVFTVARGRRFDLNPRDVPTTIQIYEGRYGREEEVEVRDTGDFHVPAAYLPALADFCTAISAKIDEVMAGATHERRILNRRARRLERAARHLLAAYQRTYNDDGVWEVEADELHLDYVIALEALLISPDDKREGIAGNIRSRASALFLGPDHQKKVMAIVQRAYKARSNYVHGDVIKDQTEKEKLKELRTLRLLTLQVILRWLVLTPSDTEDLAHLLDAAIQGTGRENRIGQSLRVFFTTTPPRNRPADITAT